MKYQLSNQSSIFWPWNCDWVFKNPVAFHDINLAGKTPVRPTRQNLAGKNPSTFWGMCWPTLTEPIYNFDLTGRTQSPSTKNMCGQEKPVTPVPTSLARKTQSPSTSQNWPGKTRQTSSYYLVLCKMVVLFSCNSVGLRGLS